jgi:hypothetical protein
MHLKTPAGEASTHYSAHMGHFQIIKIFTDFNADWSLLSDPDKTSKYAAGQTALHYAL